MSKVLDAIEIKMTGQRCLSSNTNLVSVDINVQSVEEVDCLNEVIVRVCLGTTTRYKNERLPLAIRGVKEEIANLIYGDFRAELLRLRRVLYAQDAVEALQILDSINEMIEVTNEQ